ncbi:xanthine dehydrogenase small subunit [Nocardioides halotolerans]|uniref:xanthine dehydrogenase small subunit n=1 Tax=Nocardioides halotolerans TaxID=433660 RepID=UPI0003FE4467|nr:FAD binding domain-containing protein [Nocardioides halotolerans]
MAGIVVNGAPRDLAGVPLHTNALDFLRGCGLTGAKEGCAEGECGACSVMVARPAPDGSDATEWTAINSCLVPAAALDGQEVVTSEGLGSPEDLHPVQHEMAMRGGSQCGYCTPGFVCSMAAEYYRSGRAATNGTGPRHDDGMHGDNGFDLHAISGNLCRCTGYRPIKDAAFALTSPASDDALAARRSVPAPAPAATQLHDGEAAYVRPATLAEALQLLRDHSDGDRAATVVAGSTDWGVDVNLKGARAGLVLGVDRLPELRGFSVGDDEIRIGAALTLTEVERRLESPSGSRLPLLAALMPQFASPLIRNAATLGGNLGTGSPIGDAPPVLLALEASVVLASTEGERTVALADYFTGYRESVRRPDELITEVVVPLPAAEVTAFHKIAKRAFDDISSVAVAFALDVADGVVRKARIGLGGVAATPIRALEVEAALEGRPWTQETVDAAAEVLGRAGTPISDQRASADYRAAMLGQSLRKLFAEVTS